jgi:hypothetical protein
MSNDKEIQKDKIIPIMSQNNFIKLIFNTKKIKIYINKLILD